MSGCDKEDSSVFGFEGMGVNAKALTPVNAKALTPINAKALYLENHRTDIMCLFFVTKRIIFLQIVVCFFENICYNISTESRRRAYGYKMRGGDYGF